MEVAQAEHILRNTAIEVAAACHASGIEHADINYMSGKDGEWWELSYTENGSTTTISCTGDPGE